MLMASCRASVLMSGFESCDDESEEGDVNGLCCQDPSPAAEALRANEAVRANRLRTAIVVVISRWVRERGKGREVIRRRREIRRDDGW